MNVEFKHFSEDRVGLICSKEDMHKLLCALSYIRGERICTVAEKFGISLEDYSDVLEPIIEHVNATEDAIYPQFAFKVASDD